MARKQLIEVLAHRGFKVDIRIDKESDCFCADLPKTTPCSVDPHTKVQYGFEGWQVTGASLHEVRNRVKREIDDRLGASFVPVIYGYFERRKSEDDPDGCSSVLELSFTRIYEARVGEKILHREFIPKGAVQSERFFDETEGQAGDYTWRPNDGTRLEYTPERWRSLRHLLTLMRELQGKIMAELGSTKSLEALLLRLPDTLALPAPKSPKHRKTNEK